MRKTFMYRWIELEQDATWYGNMTRYEQCIFTKKGYEEAVFENHIFCSYTGGPLWLYTDSRREFAFEMVSEIALRKLRNISHHNTLKDVFSAVGIKLYVARRILKQDMEFVGIMANPVNMTKFHHLRVVLNTKTDNDLYEYDHGRWIYGDERMYDFLTNEYDTWGKNNEAKE